MKKKKNEGLFHGTFLGKGFTGDHGKIFLCIIPSQIIEFPISVEEIISTYNSLKNKDGKVVVQSCGQGVNESGGGYTTAIISSLKEFAEYCKYFVIFLFFTFANSLLAGYCIYDLYFLLKNIIKKGLKNV